MMDIQFLLLHCSLIHYSQLHNASAIRLGKDFGLEEVTSNNDNADNNFRIFSAKYKFRWLTVIPLEYFY